MKLAIQTRLAGYVRVVLAVLVVVAGQRVDALRPLLFGLSLPADDADLYWPAFLPCVEAYKDLELVVVQFLFPFVIVFVADPLPEGPSKVAPDATADRVYT